MLLNMQNTMKCTHKQVKSLLLSGHLDAAFTSSLQENHPGNETMSSNSSEFYCPICFKKFKFKSNIKRHIETNHSEHRKLFKCEYCSTTFTQKANLKRHIQTGCKMLKRVLHLKKINS